MCVYVSFRLEIVPPTWIDRPQPRLRSIVGLWFNRTSTPRQRVSVEHLGVAWNDGRHGYNVAMPRPMLLTHVSLLLSLLLQLCPHQAADAAFSTSASCRVENDARMIYVYLGIGGGCTAWPHNVFSCCSGADLCAERLSISSNYILVECE